MSRLFNDATNDVIHDLTKSPVGGDGDTTTISMWFKPTGNTAGYYLAQIQDKDATQHRMGLIFRGSTSQTLECYTDVNNYKFSRTTASASLNNWHHAAACWNGRGLRTVWLDGSPATPERTFLDTTVLDSFSIGRAEDASPVASFKGYIAEVAVYDGIMMENEIKLLSYGIKATRVNASNLVVYAPFDTSVVEDTLGTLTLTAVGTTFDSDHPTIYDVDPPYFLSAVDAQFLVMSNLNGAWSDVVPDSRTGSLSMWVNYDRTDGDQGFFEFLGDTGFNADFWFGTSTTHEFVFENTPTFGADEDFFQWHSNGKLVTGWNHVLLTWSLGNPVTIQISINDVVGGGYFVGGTPDHSIVYWTDIDGGAGAYGSIGLGSTNDFQGCVGDVWLHPSEYIDIGVEENRRKFIDEFYRPVFLGYNGELPVGTAPLMFLRGDFTCPYQDFSGVGPIFGWLTATTGAICNENVYNFSDNQDGDPDQPFLGPPTVVAPSTPVPLYATCDCAGGPHIENEAFDLTFTITNVDLIAVTGIDLAVTLPTSLTVAADGITTNDLGGTEVAAGDTITITSGSLGILASGDVVVSVQASNMGTFSITYTLTSDAGNSTTQFITTCSCMVEEGESFVLHCLEHKFVYRPDARIYPLAHTHCPKGGEPLRSWRHRQDEEEDNTDHLDQDLFTF